MNTIRFLAAAAALLALGAGAQAADVNLDGSSTTAKKPTLAATAGQQLQQDKVPSVKTDPNGAASVKAQADADIAARQERDRRPRLKVQRQNLKGEAAARALAQQTNPNTIDRDTAYGDKDHTQQVTNVVVTVKK